LLPPQNVSIIQVASANKEFHLASTLILVVTVHFVVTSELLTSTILVCWGHIKKTFCKKVIFSVSLISISYLVKIKLAALFLN